MTTQVVRGWRSVKFLAVATHPITPADARLEQERAGYPVAGYGFEGFESDDKVDPAGQYYVAEWSCSASCD